MTTATLKARDLNKPHIEEVIVSELPVKARVVVKGRVDEEIVLQALETAEKSHLRGKVIDAICVYRGLGQMKYDFSGEQLKRCYEVIDEMTGYLWYFVNHMSLPMRKLGVRYIFEGPVAKLADASDLKSVARKKA